MKASEIRENQDRTGLTFSFSIQELNDLDHALRYAMQYVVEDALKNDLFKVKMGSLELQSFVLAKLNSWCKLLVRLDYPKEDEMKKEN